MRDDQHARELEEDPDAKDDVPPAPASGPAPIWWTPPEKAAPPPGVTPERAPRVAVAKTVNMRRVPKRQLDIWREEAAVDAELFADRPKTREDCVSGHRPCPYVSCKYHLFLDVNDDTGSITYNFKNKEPDELTESCSLDIADNGGATLEVVGEFFQVTRERIRQIEHKVLHKLKRNRIAQSVHEAGGFDEVQLSPLASFQDEGDGNGGAVTTVLPKTPEQEAHEEFADKIDRIYERTSRERVQGIRPLTEPVVREEAPEPVFLAPESEDEYMAPEQEEETSVAPEAPPPAPEEEMTKDRPIKVFELSKREALVVKHYLRLAEKDGQRPSPLAIAHACKIEGSSNGAISASVCTALTAAVRKGTVLPYYGTKRERSIAKQATKCGFPETPIRRAPRPKRVAVEPETSTAMVQVSSDPFKSALQGKRDELARQMAAIDVLLAT